MEILDITLKTLLYLLTAYLLLSGIYFMVFAIASFFYKDGEIGKINKRKSVGIFIPAYKEDTVIVETALAAKKHVSFRTNCEVIVIADQLKNETLKLLISEGITVIPVFFKKSSKSKALNYAISELETNYDYAVILDADNLMHDNFIDHIVGILNTGFKVVQGQRVAKNTNTNIATLDAISEAVNNAIFRKGHRVLGLSSSLIGSGFAIDYSLLKSLLEKTSSIGGFDKELELMILKQGITIAYSKKAIVYDEKVQEEENFVRQRRRWLSAQFVYLFANPPKSIFGKLSIDYVDKKIQFLVPPRVISIGVSFILGLLYWVISIFTHSFQILSLLTSIAWIINLTAVIIVIPSSIFTKDKLQSLRTLPKGFLLTLKALLKIRNANKQFIHTSHGLTNKA